MRQQLDAKAAIEALHVREICPLLTGPGLNASVLAGASVLAYITLGGRRRGGTQLVKRGRAALSLDRLGAREREIMESLFARREATVAEVLASLDAPPSYSAVRGMLALLEQKGYVKHRRDGLRYIYSPTVNTDAAMGSAVRKLVETFFGGSPARAVATLLELPQQSDEELTIKDLREAVLSARKQGR